MENVKINFNEDEVSELTIQEQYDAWRYEVNMDIKYIESIKGKEAAEQVPVNWYDDKALKDFEKYINYPISREKFKMLQLDWGSRHQDEIEEFDDNHMDCDCSFVLNM